MRILVTGTSPQQCGNGNRLKYDTVSDLYVAALKAAGHDVDQRVWTPGGDLTSYDVALVGLIPFNSIAARHVYTVCDVIGRARASDVGLVFMVDDWRFGDIQGAARSLSKDPRKRLFTSIKGRTDREWGEADGFPLIEACVTALATRPWPTTILPAYTWGDHSKLTGLPCPDLRFVDPTGLQADRYTYQPRSSEERERRWVLGTLSDQREWYKGLDLSWWVAYHGPTPSRAERALKEPELVDLLSRSRGCLSPPQPHAGGGWWRARFIYTAMVESVMYADPAEVAPLGELYQFEPDVIESMTDDQLTELARAQRYHLVNSSWSTEELIAGLNDVMTGALLGPVKNVVKPTPGMSVDDHPHRSLQDDPVVPLAQPVRREASRREERRFDKTYLRESKHGERVHRDYAAHFFRWGWATRLIKSTDRVLDVGCGPDLALTKVLAMGGRYVPEHYAGVDLNKLSGGPGWATLYGETNVLDWTGRTDFTKVVAFEVIEHMSKGDGIELLKVAYDVLESGGELLLSTPVFNGKAAVNHVHEWDLHDLGEAIADVGFTVKERYGTFASYPDLKRVTSDAHRAVLEELRAYYSDEVTACFLAPLYPNESRNNVWRCVKEGTDETGE